MEIAMNPLAETHAECDEMLKAISRNWLHKIPTMSFDDLLSEARYNFLIAYYTYEGNRGTAFDTWVFEKVLSGFMDMQRRYFKEQERRRQLAVDGFFTQKKFCLDELINEVSEDARQVIRIVTIDTPPTLLKAMRTKNPQFTLANLLKDLGWSATRILFVFQELREALGGTR